MSNIKDIEIGSKDSRDRDSCHVPGNVKLEWKREQLVLDVTLREAEFGQPIRSKRGARVCLLSRIIPGYARVNLADANSRTTVRQTLPQPEPRSRRQARTAIASSRRRRQWSRGGTRGRSGESTSVHVSRLEELVSAPMPGAPDPSIQTNGRLWSGNGRRWDGTLMTVLPTSAGLRGELT